MQIRTTMQYHLILVKWPSSKDLQTISITEGAKKRKPSYSVGENANWYNHYGKQQGVSSKKKKTLKTELLYDPAIPLLDIYPEKTIFVKDTRTLMFTAALFIIAKMWNQPKCPWREEWIKKALVYIYNGVLLSHKKK